MSDEQRPSLVLDEATIPETQLVTKSSKWPYITLAILFFVGVFGVVTWNVELPYLAYSAGPVSDAATSISADGVDVFPATGELLMLTVISQDVNLFEFVVATFDSSIDLIRKEAVRRPGETDAEYRERSLQQMDDSNFRAIAVALDFLGYEMVAFEVKIDHLIEGVPAEGVLLPGDTIISVEGVEVSSVAEISPLVQGHAVGSTIDLVVLRDGEEVAVTVELAPREDDPEVAMIGVALTEMVEPPFPVIINAGSVGGPSAGLMHTLAIIDHLTEGELTGGNVIAGTGTIAPDGTVGAIGGVRQKVVAAEAAGARYILVPEDNYQSALTAPRTRIEIVPVATLTEAMDFLATVPAG